MSRALRLEYPGALWHVTSRGNERRPIFRDDADREQFVEIMAETATASGWLIHAWVLMGNHYHLLVETPETTLSAGMRQLNGIYTQAFNRRHRRAGHLLQGRFKGILVEKGAHLSEMIRYIVRNPVRAKLCAKAADWRWSSYRATAGLVKAPPWLEIDATLAMFDRRSRAQGRAAYRRHVNEIRGAEYRPWSGVTGQIYLGNADFIRAQKKRIARLTISGEVPAVQRAPAPPDMAAIAGAVASAHGLAPEALSARGRGDARTMAACLARRRRLTLKVIGESLGGTQMTAGLLALAGERKAKTEKAYAAILKKIEAAL